ncbi:hypothetical protein DIPPA_23408 [Diplonema papillatum]|nr:hypothetical protein DIPPA_23408 [Diplonema papillatum]KAJ9445524.1 hypothetical protein DIPPA_23408 [Diplonema papillatum]
MRELREEEVYHAVEELLKAKTGKAHGRFKSVEAVSASLEASLMRLHDPCDTAVAGPRKQSCDKPAVHPRKESLAPCIEVTPPNTSLTPDADGLPPRGAAGTRRERFMSMISSKLRLDGLDDVKAAAVTGQGATGTPRTARSNTPPGRARNWAEAGDMRALHGTVRVVCQLFKRFLAPPTPAEHMSGEQVIKAFAKKVLTDHPTRRDHPFREQFNAVVELALDADESDPAISAADAGRLSQSIAGLLARLFLTVKAYKQRQTVETNKVVLSTPPPAAPLVASRRPSAFPAMPGPAARLTPISVDLAQPQQQAKKPAPRVRAQVLSVTPPGGGGGPALKSITSPSNGRLVSSQGPRLGRAPPKAAGGGGGARRKRSKSASAGTSKAGDEDGLTVETDSASDGDPASSDRDSTTMTGSPISSLRKESAKRSK